MGYAHPDIWLEQITADQLAEWEAYDSLEPIGLDLRADFRSASLMSMLTNIARSIWSKKGCKMTTPEDFMPKWSEEEQEEPQKQTVEEQKGMLQMIAAAFGNKKESNG